MAEGMQAVGLQVHVPDMPQKMSQFLSIRSQKLGLQGQAADVQMTQQTAKQRAAMADIDWDKHMGEDGTLDLNSFIKDKGIRKAAGDAYPELVDKATEIRDHQLGAKSSLLKLNNEQVSAYASMLGGIANDEDVVAGNEAGKAKAKAAFTQFAQTYGMDAAKAVAPVALPLMNNQIPGDKLAKMIGHVQMQALDTSRQLEAMKSQPQFIQSPQGLQPVETNAYAPGGVGKPIGGPIAQGVAPQIVTSPTTGNPFKLNPNATVTPVTEQTPNKTPFGQGYQGQKEDIAHYQGEVQSVRQAGDQAPLAHNINQQILRLSNDARTGPGSEAWQHAIAAVGAPFGLSPSASYQEIGKFLEKNAIANMQSMGGPPSDARLSAASAANGSTHFSKEALQAVTKFNDATTTALAQYRQGIDHAVGMGKNVDYTNLPKFKSAWAKAFDVNVFRFENALRDGDAKELATLKNELGPTGAKALIEKRRKLDQLASGNIGE